MKKTLSILIIGFGTMLLLSMCDKQCEEKHSARITDLSAVIYDGEEEISDNETVSSRNFSLRMRFELSFADYAYIRKTKSIFPAAYAYSDCIPYSNGLADNILTVSLECDKPIGNLAAGQNLIAGIYHGVNPQEEYSLQEWMDMLNSGSNPIHNNGPMLLGCSYLFTVSTLFSGVEVVEDDYTFTFSIGYASGRNPYAVTFAPVRLT